MSLYFVQGKLDILYRWDTPVSAVAEGSGGLGGDAEEDEFLLLGDDEARQAALSSSAAAIELRASGAEEIALKLEQILVQVSRDVPLETPIDRTAPLMDLGLDSVTVYIHIHTYIFIYMNTHTIPYRGELYRQE